MSRRLKVLLSVYACRPDTGSESELGWQWAFQMARFHEVTVLTRAANRGPIELALMALPRDMPAPTFAYFDRAAWLLKLKQHTGDSPWWYYLLWQRGARRVVARLVREQRFDLLHHLTWGEFRSVPAVYGHGLPTIRGPFGGVEATPWRLLPWRYPRAFCYELVRNLNNLRVLAGLIKMPGACRTIIVSTIETQAAFDKLGLKTSLLPETGTPATNYTRRPPPTGRLKFLYAGRLVFFKGVHFALHAVKQSSLNVQLTIAGEGALLRAMQKLSQQLGLGSQVSFENNDTRAKRLKRYQDFDAFIYPSLHDSGALSIIEASASGLPVICLNCGGPALAVGEGCGFKIPPGKLTDIVSGLANAMRFYDQNRNKLAEHGRAAWQHAMEKYRWDRKGEQMDSIYQAVARGLDATA